MLDGIGVEPLRIGGRPCTIAGAAVTLGWTCPLQAAGAVRNCFMQNNPAGPEQFIELEALLREAQDEQAAIHRLITRISRYMTDAALEEFPSLKQMSAGQLRDFADALSRAATTFAMKADHLAFVAEQEKT